MALATDDGRSTRGGHQSRDGDLAGAGESEKPFEVGPCVSVLSLSLACQNTQDMTCQSTSNL